MRFLIISSNTDVIASIKRYLKFVHTIADIKSFQITHPEDKTYENFLIIKDWFEGLFVDVITEM